MQAKDIKRLVNKQLKANFQPWQRLTKKEKKALAVQVLNEVMANHKAEQTNDVPIHELTNMPDIPPGIIPLHEMEKFIADHNCNLLQFNKYSQRRNLNDPELRLIDSLLDDRVLNSLLGTPSYTPAMQKGITSAVISRRTFEVLALCRDELSKVLPFDDQQTGT
jgi:hypothetical protein